MQPGDAKTPAARAFVRSLNISLKFARLYGFEHSKTSKQLETAWNDLQAALLEGGQTPLQIGARGTDLLINGSAVHATLGERTFIEFLGAVGAAAMDFAPDVQREDLNQLVRAFPTKNQTPSDVPEQLRSALAGNPRVRIRETEPAARDAANAGVVMDGPEAENTASTDTSGGDWLSNPQRLLQVLEQAEGFHNDAGTGGAPHAPSIEEEILTVVKLLTDLSAAAEHEKDASLAILQEGLTKLTPQSQGLLQELLAEFAASKTPAQSDEPLLLRLASSTAVRMARESFEACEIRVDSVPQLFERVAESLQKLAATLSARHPASSALRARPDFYASLLESEFWSGISEQSKRTILNSPEAWCVPADVIRPYVEQIRRNGNENLAHTVLRNYIECLQSENPEARRRAAAGLESLTDLYATDGEHLLQPAIQWSGAQLSLERDESLQVLISGTFVRLTQEAGASHAYTALLQSLDSLDALGEQRLALAQSLRPRITLEKRIPELIEEALHRNVLPEGLSAVLQRVPKATGESILRRFNRGANCQEMLRLEELARSAGGDVLAALRDTLRGASASEAAEAVALLSRVDLASVERLLPERLRQWPRYAQDRVVRLIATGGAPERGMILSNILDLLDPVLLPLAVDEIGLSKDPSCVNALLRLAEGDMSRRADSFIRLKAVEALGRLRAQEAMGLLRKIAESRHMLHWKHHMELRLAAIQALSKIDPDWVKDFLPKSGFKPADLALSPVDAHPDYKRFRRRRYPRVRLSQPVPAVATRGHEACRFDVRVLSLSGGLATGEKHLQPGALATIKLGSNLRPIRVQVLMRDVRAQALGFEFVEMDLDERARLRTLLLDNLSGAVMDEQELLAETHP